MEKLIGVLVLLIIISTFLLFQQHGQLNAEKELNINLWKALNNITEYFYKREKASAI